MRREGEVAQFSSKHEREGRGEHESMEPEPAGSVCVTLLSNMFHLIREQVVCVVLDKNSHKLACQR